MPYHPRVGILVFGDEGERLLSPVIVAAIDQGVDGNEAVAGKEPRVLWPPGISGRTVASYQPTA